jgi:hypothetical protein
MILIDELNELMNIISMMIRKVKNLIGHDRAITNHREGQTIKIDLVQNIQHLLALAMTNLINLDKEMMIIRQQDRDQEGMIKMSQLEEE